MSYVCTTGTYAHFVVRSVQPYNKQTYLFRDAAPQPVQGSPVGCAALARPPKGLHTKGKLGRDCAPARPTAYNWLALKAWSARHTCLVLPCSAPAAQAARRNVAAIRLVLRCATFGEMSHCSNATALQRSPSQQSRRTSVPSMSLKHILFKVVAFLSSAGLSSMILFVESGSISTIVPCHTLLLKPSQYLYGGWFLWTWCGVTASWRCLGPFRRARLTLTGVYQAGVHPTASCTPIPHWRVGVF